MGVIKGTTAAGPVLNNAIAKVAKQKYGIDLEGDNAGNRSDERVLEVLHNREIVRDDGVAYGSCLVGVGSIWLSAETYNDIVAHDDCYFQFQKDAGQWEGGMKYLLEETHYRDALNADDGGSVDPLTQLEMDSRSLLVRMASAGDMSEVQVRLFAECIADLRARRQALLEQMETVDSYIELAGVALVESS